MGCCQGCELFVNLLDSMGARGSFFYEASGVLGALDMLWGKYHRMNKNNSPYSAAITGCAMLYYEFGRILPTLLSEDREQLLKDEIENNQVLQINSRKARRTFVLEFKRRFASVPIHLWQSWQEWSEEGQRAGLFYAILKTYRLVFDVHFNVAVRRWNSVDCHLDKSDIMMEFNEISAHDEFVDSWSENTKSRCASHYLTILRQTGLLTEKTNELQSIHPSSSELEYYIRSGEEWFLEACLLYPYEINNIKLELICRE